MQREDEWALAYERDFSHREYSYYKDTILYDEEVIAKRVRKGKRYIIMRKRDSKTDSFDPFEAAVPTIGTSPGGYLVHYKGDMFRTEFFSYKDFRKRFIEKT